MSTQQQEYQSALQEMVEIANRKIEKMGEKYRLIGAFDGGSFFSDDGKIFAVKDNDAEDRGFYAATAREVLSHFLDEIAPGARDAYPELSDGHSFAFNTTLGSGELQKLTQTSTALTNLSKELDDRFGIKSEGKKFRAGPVEVTNRTHPSEGRWHDGKNGKKGGLGIK